MIARRYTNTPYDDLLLANWFSLLHTTGDWHKLFRSPQSGIGWFYAYFQRDVQLWLVEAQGTVVLAGWFEPLNDGGTFFSLWVHPTQRPRKRTLLAYGELLAYGIEHTGIVLGVTKQENLLDAHRKMGYTVHGPIPGLWRNTPAWLMTITREQLEGGSYGKCLRRRSQIGQPEYCGVGCPPAGSADRAAHGPPPAPNGTRPG